MADEPNAPSQPSFAALPVGHRFAPATFSVDEAALDAYLRAVDDAQPHYGPAGPRVDGRVIVPPVAVAAFALKRLAGDLALQPGAVHMGQDYEFHSPVYTDQQLVADSRVVTRSRRRGMVILIVEQDVRRGSDTVLTGRSTLGVPEDASPRPDAGL